MGSELTRRQLLATIAAAPLAQFCKAEPVLAWQSKVSRDLVKMPDGTVMPAWRLKYRDARLVERRYALPQGTLE